VIHSNANVYQLSLIMILDVTFSLVFLFFRECEVTKLT